MHRRVLVLFPKGDTTPIEAFRHDWDPLAKTIPAHITLAYPFDDAQTADERAASLASVAASVRPFQVVLQRLALEDDEYLFLLADEGGAQAQHLHDAIYAGPLAVLPKPVRFIPHMTIARHSDPLRVREAELAATKASISLAGMATSLSFYRIEGCERHREFDLPLG